MPKRKHPRGKYRRIRKESPKKFVKKTFRTVPVSHTEFKNRYKKRGTKAIVGKYKKQYKKKYIWGTQSIIIPK